MHLFAPLDFSFPHMCTLLLGVSQQALPQNNLSPRTGSQRVGNRNGAGRGFKSCSWAKVAAAALCCQGGQASWPGVRGRETLSACEWRSSTGTVQKGIWSADALSVGIACCFTLWIRRSRCSLCRQHRTALKQRKSCHMYLVLTTRWAHTYRGTFVLSM